MVISGQKLARRRRLAAGLLAFGFLAASSLSGSPAIAEPPPVADIAVPVDIGGGRSLYLECHGSGAPTVILESGYHDSSDLWTISDVQPPVARGPRDLLRHPV